MELPDPWGHYSRRAVPPGWSYPLGRDQIRAALVDADAFVDYLDLHVPHPHPPRPQEPAHLVVLSARHVGDASGGYFTPKGFVRPPLSMTLCAVPASLRLGVREELLTRWLPRACAWASEARRRGNVWTASDHGLLVRLDGPFLTAEES